MKRTEKIKELLRSKELKETKHYSKKVSIISLIAIALLIIMLTVAGIIFINYEFTETDSFDKLVEENYLLSVIFIILICTLQVMIALVPSEIVEIASGYAFGPWLGALYCLIGIMIGSAIVILLTRKFGRRFVESLYPREKIDSLPILRDEKKLNFLVTLFFFIPGTPKDLITYAIGLTRMRILTYILLTSAARFPSIIISTLSGGALNDNELTNAVIFFLISIVTGVIGYVIYMIISKRGKKKDKNFNK